MTSTVGFNRDMKSADLEVGQELILAHTDNWGRPIELRKMVVMRKTKTRVVLAEARDPKLPQYRLMVDSYDDTVTGRYEGQSQWNSRLDIYNTDDPEVEKLKRERVIGKHKSEAVEAARAFAGQRDVETARAAVNAMNAYIEIAEEEQ